MEKEAICCLDAPAAIGPYSQAIKCGEFLFVSGQLPFDPQTGLIPTGIEDQARQALKNLQAVLEAGNSSVGKVVKTTVFLQEMDDFSAVNAVYGDFFDEKPPARACVQVARLPKDAGIEIEAIAIAG